MTFDAIVLGRTGFLCRQAEVGVGGAGAEPEPLPLEHFIGRNWTNTA